VPGRHLVTDTCGPFTPECGCAHWACPEIGGILPVCIRLPDRFRSASAAIVLDDETTSPRALRMTSRACAGSAPTSSSTTSGSRLRRDAVCPISNWLADVRHSRSERPSTAKGLSIRRASGQGWPRRPVATLSSSAHRQESKSRHPNRRRFASVDVQGTKARQESCSYASPAALSTKRTAYEQSVPTGRPPLRASGWSPIDTLFATSFGHN
jgi:hypothetical protein